ncbi:MAG: hypothetical protein JWM63_2377 [Gammaproteobacteria bacterium]|nr:hypothetical protein [Gammaproteobacteria bacterium]
MPGNASILRESFRLIRAVVCRLRMPSLMQ